MAIEVFDGGAVLACFHLTPGGGGWELYGRGVRRVELGAGGEAIVLLNEPLQAAVPAPLVNFAIVATCHQSDTPGAYAAVRLLPNDEGTAVQRLGVFTYVGTDAGNAPLFAARPCSVLVIRLPLPFVNFIN
jgi:hypothetical protein